MIRWKITTPSKEFIVYANSWKEAFERFGPEPNEAVVWEDPVTDDYNDMTKCGLVDFGCGDDV